MSASNQNPEKSHQHVAVLGASPKSERYSNQAVRLLLQHQHNITAINPGFDLIEGQPCVATLADIQEPVDTLTLYRSASQLTGLIDDIITLKPKRVIFNPGTESWDLQQALTQAGIPWQENCTLVMLRGGYF
ncbi:CoA-binding protein [Oceanospirillum maris]|jgi:predicted CoA-binding protein|uniref:CoA-binding protein n=1 Tax=Oceanospirillum maris TaxID=64977 RepID=UPI00040E7BFA|nr:CoA-binding protein [Oceanospirillum maris]